MVLYVRNNNVKPTSTVKVNVPDPQHTPINNGQGGVLPSAYADPPTNANGTQANLDFDPQTISNSTRELDLAYLGANNQPPKTDLDMILMGADYKVEIDKGYQQADYQVTSDGVQIDNRNLAKENTPPPVSVNAPSPSMVGGNRLTQEEYQVMLKQQKQNKTKNFVPISSPKVEKLELNAKDFFKGTKTGNEVFKTVDVFGNDGSKKGTKTTNAWADFDYDGDFFGSDPFSNQKSNSKALKKQFDYYKSISNF